jgi:hypothetical protein
VRVRRRAQARHLGGRRRDERGVAHRARVAAADGRRGGGQGRDEVAVLVELVAARVRAQQRRLARVVQQVEVDERGAEGLGELDDAEGEGLLALGPAFEGPLRVVLEGRKRGVGPGYHCQLAVVQAAGLQEVHGCCKVRKRGGGTT